MPIQLEHHEERYDQVEDRGKDIKENLGNGVQKALDASIQARHDRSDAFGAMEAQGHAMEPPHGALEQRVMNAQAGVPCHPTREGVGNLAKDAQSQQSTQSDQE